MIFKKKMYALKTKDEDGKTLIYIVTARTEKGARKRCDWTMLDPELEVIDVSRANLILLQMQEGEFIFPQGSVVVKGKR